MQNRYPSKPPQPPRDRNCGGLFEKPAKSDFKKRKEKGTIKYLF